MAAIEEDGLGRWLVADLEASPVAVAAEVDLAVSVEEALEAVALGGVGDSFRTLN